MAKPLPLSEPHRPGTNGDHARSAAAVAREEALQAAGLEILDDDLEDEIARLGTENEQIVRDLGFTLTEDGGGGEEEAAALRAENERLKGQVAELQRALVEARDMQQLLTEQQKEYEGLLEEKSEVIRELHRKLHEQPAHAPGSVPREEELLALSEELERERKQLKEDEEALMEQMRQMEVQMSRERAELARQRSELQRLQNDIRHELELASRDATLRDRLAPLQRRHQDMVARTGGARPAEPPAPERPAGAPQPGQNSGLFRRLFG